MAVGSFGLPLAMVLLLQRINQLRGENVQSSILRFAQRFFLVVGLVTLAYAGGTLAYAQLYQQYESSKFEYKIDTIDLKKPVAGIAEPVELNEGTIIGKLEIPRIGISVMALHGVEENTPLLGAGHVPGTPLPGGDGNSALAGHRDTFFRKLENIRAGDRIEFSTVRRTLEYLVTSTEVVEPEDTRTIESHGIQELTLISCFPFYFVGAAPHRFIVHAVPAS